MRRLTLLAGILLTACSSALAQPSADTLDQVLALLAARPQGHVGFTEVHRMGMLKEPLRSSGELIYQAPDHLEKRTLEPRPETLTLDHGVLTAQRGRHTHSLELADYPQAVPFIESIRATLAGDRAALEHYFTLGFSGELARWQLILTPKDPALARAVTRIEIEGARDTIDTVTIAERDGDSSRIQIGAALP